MCIKNLNKLLKNIEKRLIERCLYIHHLSIENSIVLYVLPNSYRLKDGREKGPLRINSCYYHISLREIVLSVTYFTLFS